jgi:hypothetical protein
MSYSGALSLTPAIKVTVRYLKDEPRLGHVKGATDEVREFVAERLVRLGCAEIVGGVKVESVAEGMLF